VLVAAVTPMPGSDGFGPVPRVVSGGVVSGWSHPVAVQWFGAVGAGGGAGCGGTGLCARLRWSPGCVRSPRSPAGWPTSRLTCWPVPTPEHVHLLAAMAHETVLVLAQTEVGAKTNEVPRLKDLITGLAGRMNSPPCSTPWTLHPADRTCPSVTLMSNAPTAGSPARPPTLPSWPTRCKVAGGSRRCTGSRTPSTGKTAPLS
jgi:hypothetical protein